MRVNLCFKKHFCWLTTPVDSIAIIACFVENLGRIRLVCGRLALPSFTSRFDYPVSTAIKIWTPAMIALEIRAMNPVNYDFRFKSKLLSLNRFTIDFSWRATGIRFQELRRSWNYRLRTGPQYRYYSVVDQIFLIWGRPQIRPLGLRPFGILQTCT